MAPAPWPGAGAAPHDNVLGLDPQLSDPEHGDFRPRAGSPARGYGCQTFAADRPARSGPPPPPPPPDEDPAPGRVEVAGRLTEDTRWATATVAVVGDVRVEDGVTLAIAPGVRVEFQGYHRLEVAGTLLAVGTPRRPILLTSAQPELFTLDRSTRGAWNGIRFDGTRATNAPSRLAWCVLEHSKATGREGAPYAYGGGALSVVDVAQLSLEQCVLRRNVAEYGGALFLYRNASVRLVGNLVTDNHALRGAAAIYCGYSQPQLAHNTIVGNHVHNAASPYEDTCAILGFLSKPLLVDGILRDNDADVPVLHQQLWGGKPYYTRRNAIERYPRVNGNFPDDPLFVDPAAGDWRLRWGSPCVDAAVDPGPTVAVAPRDLAGSPRTVDGDLDRAERADLGALELVPLALRGEPSPGRRVAVEVLGPPGGVVSLFAARGGLLPTPLRTPFGQLDLDRGGMVLLGQATLAGGRPALLGLLLPHDLATWATGLGLQGLVRPAEPAASPAWTNALELIRGGRAP